ncbi:glycoside hydrolase [Hymenobacter sp. BT186]|uniref:Glycoside hydrolase n=1 Tax=Hymenobacter telluris TaxID=2816474 RepID=A0A939JBV4_9BACT|nr:glycosyl hydrolase family 65 protein [Hymenobacter telluris]MBO0356652.1 glycoside hydrolase [Hymenobacter telluris]MBW3372677.1 glycoside hydrolase [Hymenobacter norwichensis]
MQLRIPSFLVLLGLLGGCNSTKPTTQTTSARPVLTTDGLRASVARFNALDKEDVINLVPNAQTADWMAAQVPLFECPDSVLQQTYYYRWWTMRKHLKQTPDGYVFTEFITPMKHAGTHNTISSALGHHLNEGRWLHDPQYVNQYTKFWLYVDSKRTAPKLHGFSSWLQDAVYELYKVQTDKGFVQEVLPALTADYRLWEKERMLPNGMFWQYDVKDAMEESISGGRKEKNVRPTINSYMYGNAKALAAMAQLTKNDTLERKYAQKAEQLRQLVNTTLWDNKAAFYKVQYEKGGLCEWREELGYIPWYFSLPPDEPKYANQWTQLTDEAGFKAPWGITTAERRAPGFRTHGSGHGCEWDGAVWPYATTQTLKGLANLLTEYRNQDGMSAQIYYDELRKYAASHQKNGEPYLGEYQDEKNGEWLKGDNPRSSYYNHSGFADLIITGLVGLKPRPDNVVEVFPLVPAGKWDYFCLDQVRYHGRLLTVLWDKTGTKYNKGQGLRIFADGKEIGHADELKRVTAKL